MARCHSALASLSQRCRAQVGAPPSSAVALATASPLREGGGAWEEAWWEDELPAPDAHGQALLRNLGAAEVAFGILRLPLPARAAPAHRRACASERRALLVGALDFVTAFCAGNAHNQQLAVAQLPLLLAHLDALPGPALAALHAAFASNRNLCAAAPASLFSALVRLHHAAAHSPPAQQLLSPRATPAGAAPPPMRCNRPYAM